MDFQSPSLWKEKHKQRFWVKSERDARRKIMQNGVTFASVALMLRHFVKGSHAASGPLNIDLGFRKRGQTSA